MDIEPDEFIKTNFDFDLCAIGFNFAKNKFVNLIEKSNYKSLYIQDTYIDKMIGKNTDSYSNYRAYKTTARIIKYINRGFEIENWKEFLLLIRDYMCN